MMARRITILLSAILSQGILQHSVSLAGGIEAITKPSGDVTLSFLRPGRVAEVPAKEGDAVRAGQELVRQDDAAEQAQLDQLKAQAEDTARIEAAQADLDQKNVDHEKLDEAAKHGAATKWEVEHARLDVTIAELSLRLARFENQQDRRKYEEFKIQVERMRLGSPIDGKVERVFIQPGESVDALKDVVRVVKIDPLWVDVPVPLDQAKGLRLGQSAEVEFAGTEIKTIPGKIIHIAAVAEMNTRTVRVELSNNSDRPAGEYVKVSFPAVGQPAGVPKEFSEHSETH